MRACLAAASEACLMPFASHVSRMIFRSCSASSLPRFHGPRMVTRWLFSSPRQTARALRTPPIIISTSISQARSLLRALSSCTCACISLSAWNKPFSFFCSKANLNVNLSSTAILFSARKGPSVWMSRKMSASLATWLQKGRR